MHLIAIGNIINDTLDTVGLRILDIENGQIKDVPKSSVEKVIESGTVDISNIDIVNSEIHGKCGTLDSLPKILNNNIYGKSPVIILSRLNSEGFRVCNWAGNIVCVKTSNLIEYGNVHGISNGKIVDNKYIACKSGEFKVEAIQNDSEYTGEFEEGIEALLPVVRVMSVYVSPDKYRDMIVRYSTEDKRLTYTPTSWNVAVGNINEITKRMVYRSSKFTLIGKVYNRISILRHEQLIRMALQLQEVRDSVDYLVSRMTSKRGNNCRKASLTGIPAPTNRDKYGPILIDYTKLSSITETVDYMEIERYVNYIIDMNTYILLYIDTNTDRIALARKVTSKGIDYKTISGKNSIEVENTRLEDIYSNKEVYSNVVVTDNIMTIVGLDGAYTYDMDKIQRVYKRNSVKSAKSAKAALLGIKYNEEIEESGLLRKLEADSNELVIPSNVTEIGNGSIAIFNTSRIVFTHNIIKSGAGVIKYSTQESIKKNLESIEIQCNSKAGVGILKSVEKLGVIKSIRIHFNRDINSEEFIIIARNTGLNCVTASNIKDNKVSSRLGEEALELLIKDNQKYIDRLMKNEYKSRSEVKATQKKLKSMYNDMDTMSISISRDNSDKIRRLQSIIENIYYRSVCIAWKVVR